ncbi:transposase [Geomicrobium sp. JCM 19038]|uniref:transposase n=1 Tax=Geomicrobium sp. JCM 19038 TaxID=1460635 RepID=UPI0009DFDF7B
MTGFNIISSIPGVGKLTSSMILRRSGTFITFKRKKAFAFTGIDPGVFSSGCFTASSTRIKKTWIKASSSCHFLGCTMFDLGEY